jgi:UDP-N-acetylglucosamine--N-acetylmuramyl-(pentapeptide) pyrophosphoryl-undecaprenol N-acetylglucosamine transferase
LPSLKIILSGGGTGGHIFPAISVANEIRRRVPDAEILFVGAKGRMEMEKVPQAGYAIEGLHIAGIQRRMSLANLMLPFKLLRSLWQARKIVRAFKPHVVVGTGGYASGAVLRMAAWMRVPILIQEQNSYAGLTNRLLARSASRICVAFEGMDAFFPREKIVVTGNPVRRNAVEIDGKRDEAIAFFGLHPERKTLLIIGGSLGARAINDALLSQLEKLAENNIQVVWQTGKVSFEAVSAFQSEFIRPFQFIDRMDLAYAAADLVISRAGAIAVTEICITGKAAILVPLPSAAEDHQTRNAEALTAHDAALIVNNEQAQEYLVDKAISLLISDAEREKLAKNAAALALPNAAVLIADEVLKLARYGS